MSTAGLKTSPSSIAKSLISRLSFEPLHISEGRLIGNGSSSLQRCDWFLPRGAELVATPAQVASAISRLVGQVVGPLVHNSKREFGTSTVLIQVLEGGAHFATKLAEAVGCHLQIASLIVSSDSKGIRWCSEFPSVVGRQVLLVTDVVQSGRTLNQVVAKLLGKGAHSVYSIALIDKDTSPKRASPDFAALKVHGRLAKMWFAGCGMDWQGELRFLDWILAAEPGAQLIDHLRDGKK